MTRQLIWGVILGVVVLVAHGALASGCGFVAGVDTVANRVVATHDGEGARALRMEGLVAVPEVTVSGIDSGFEATLTTVEWQGPAGPDPDQAVNLEFVLNRGELTLAASGGGESVTVEALEALAARNTPLSVTARGDYVQLDGLDGGVTVQTSGRILATAIGGPLEARSDGSQRVECSGPVQLESDKEIRVSAPTRGSISAGDYVQATLDDGLEGPLTFDAASWIKIDVAGTRGITFGVQSEAGLITVSVGDTQYVSDDEVERQVIEVRGGGVLVEVVAEGAISIVDAMTEPAP